jgi:hypothetical protein
MSSVDWESIETGQFSRGHWIGELVCGSKKVESGVNALDVCRHECITPGLVCQVGRVYVDSDLHVQRSRVQQLRV